MRRRCGMKYFVSASGGPGFASPEEALKILEKIILPSFEMLIKLEGEKKIACWRAVICVYHGSLL
jgi:hypothetical protein